MSCLSAIVELSLESCHVRPAVTTTTAAAAFLAERTGNPSLATSRAFGLWMLVAGPHSLDPHLCGGDCDFEPECGFQFEHQGNSFKGFGL